MLKMDFCDQYIFAIAILCSSIAAYFSYSSSLFVVMIGKSAFPIPGYELHLLSNFVYASIKDSGWSKHLLRLACAFFTQKSGKKKKNSISCLYKLDINILT